MKKILLTSFFCLYIVCVSAQCTISPFIQQNYEFDAKLLVLQEIENNINDPDYDNPIISQSRTDDYLEKISAIYNNPQNDVNIDSLFNEFQFHVGTSSTHYKTIHFSVDTNTSWVQSLKDTGTTGMAAFDNLLSQYQFSVSSSNDYTTPPWVGKTIFRLVTSNQILNTYALRDDFQNASPGASLSYNLTHFNDDTCNYSGIPYSLETYELPPQQAPVSACGFYENSSNGNWYFVLQAGCIFNITATQYRFVTVSDDCSQVNFSRTLSTEDAEPSSLAIYPNPTSDKLQIQGITNIQQLEIYSVLGTAMNISLDTSQNTLNVSSLKNGVYFLKVTDAQNRIVVRKFVKK
jgi:hypothetical protein